MILLLTSSRDTVEATVKALADDGFEATATHRGKGGSMISVPCMPAECDKVVQVAKAIDRNLDYAR